MTFDIPWNRYPFEKETTRSLLGMSGPNLKFGMMMSWSLLMSSPKAWRYLNWCPLTIPIPANQCLCLTHVQGTNESPKHVPDLARRVVRVTRRFMILMQAGYQNLYICTALPFLVSYSWWKKSCTQLNSVKLHFRTPAGFFPSTVPSWVPLNAWLRWRLRNSFGELQWGVSCNNPNASTEVSASLYTSWPAFLYHELWRNFWITLQVFPAKHWNTITIIKINLTIEPQPNMLFFKYC